MLQAITWMNLLLLAESFTFAPMSLTAVQEAESWQKSPMFTTMSSNVFVHPVKKKIQPQSCVTNFYIYFMNTNFLKSFFNCRRIELFGTQILRRYWRNNKLAKLANIYWNTVCSKWHTYNSRKIILQQRKHGISVFILFRHINNYYDVTKYAKWYTIFKWINIHKTFSCLPKAGSISLPPMFETMNKTENLHSTMFTKTSSTVDFDSAGNKIIEVIYHYYS